MANLIIIDNKKGTKNLNEQEVHPEETIEKLIFETENILPDVFLLKRQLQTYSRDERIDLVGIDNENNILVIEIKDETADESVIPQVMKYALWVETHPDAIKSIWLEQKNKPEDFTFDWEKEFSIKIMIIAPSFKPSVQKLIYRITYPVELIEFKKFSDGQNDYIFLNKVLVEEEKPVKPVSTIREYDEKYYKEHYNPKSAEEFWKLANNIEGYIKSRGWNLTRSNNKGYVSFKYGFPIVFGITFIGSKSFCLFFKIPKEASDKIKIEGYEPYRYEEQWKQVLYKVESSDIDLKKFDPLFEAAYKNIVGEK
ncbi:MAG: hypothetical protein OCU22_07485 [Canidatus Methanoxibalbensis ujae]|nr:hypothetical protein [Candidatus Methanoxibalbensis ujae]